jgi:hypothetical protein
MPVLSVDPMLSETQPVEAVIRVDHRYREIRC